MKLVKVDLPRKYEVTKSTPKKYHKYKGWNKISYSQKSSFTDPKYIGDYFASYFLKMPQRGNIFSTFGNKCGEWWEKLDCSDLSDEDLKVLKENLPRPKTAKYETEVVIDLEPFGLEKTCIQGFIDQEDEPEPKKLIITDLKTGNHTDKPIFYGSDKYQQTTMYSYARDTEGYEILDSRVLLLERKGNTDDNTAFSKAGNPLWLRLSGKILEIKTPYSKERAEQFLKEVVDVVIEISDYYKTYKKYFK